MFQSIASIARSWSIVCVSSIEHGAEQRDLRAVDALGRDQDEREREDERWRGSREVGAGVGEDSPTRLPGTPRRSIAAGVRAAARRIESPRAHHGAGEVTGVAGRGRGVQRLPRRGGRALRAARLRLRRVRQAAPPPRVLGGRRGRRLAPARRPHPRPRAVRVRAHLRAAPAARAGRRAPGHRLARPAAADRARRRRRRLPAGVLRRRDAGRAHRAGVRADGVRAAGHVLARAARGRLPRGAALPAHATRSSCARARRG